MSLMTELRQWCSIRTAVKELFSCENILYRAQEACNVANDLPQQRQSELESIDNKLQRYKRKQESSSTRKQEKHIKLVNDFEARHVAANADVNRAFQEAQNQSRKLEHARWRRGHRQVPVESRIRDFCPTIHVMVMDTTDITSINMMRDQMKELHFTMGKSMTDANRVSIERAARNIGIRRHWVIEGWFRNILPVNIVKN